MLSRPKEISDVISYAGLKHDPVSPKPRFSRPFQSAPSNPTPATLESRHFPTPKTSARRRAVRELHAPGESRFTFCACGCAFLGKDVRLAFHSKQFRLV